MVDISESLQMTEILEKIHEKSLKNIVKTLNFNGFSGVFSGFHGIV
jgi:hypothetical protein